MDFPARSSSCQFRLWKSFLLGGLLAVGSLAALFRARITFYDRDFPTAQVASNIRQIHMALFEFENEYGKFPDADTIELVRSKTGTSLSLGTNFSNDYFRQLLADGIGNENIFYAKTSASRKPDEIITASKALEKGECGFCYIPSVNSGSHSNYPVVISGLIPGTDRVDKRAGDGKASVLYADGSAGVARVDSEEHLLFFGKRLLDPDNPIWEGKGPRIAWPE